METKDRIVFEIEGNEFTNVKKFRKQHKKCPHGMAGEQFEYSFFPSGLGLCAIVKCSCGQTLSIGDFMDHKIGDYDEYENRVLTEEDHRNKQFEDAVYSILQLRNPRIYRIAFGQDQSFEMIYGLAYGSAITLSKAGDDRFINCLLLLREIGRDNSPVKNYDAADESEKLRMFYDHLQETIRKELDKYGCRNKLVWKELDKQIYEV